MKQICYTRLWKKTPQSNGNHKKCFTSIAVMYQVFIWKGKAAVLNVHGIAYGCEHLMWIQESFHLVHPATAPAAPPRPTWVAAESPAAPVDCKAEKAPVVAPPYTADWIPAAMLPPATPKK